FSQLWFARANQVGGGVNDFGAARGRRFAPPVECLGGCLDCPGDIGSVGFGSGPNQFARRGVITGKRLAARGGNPFAVNVIEGIHSCQSSGIGISRDATAPWQGIGALYLILDSDSTKIV